MATTIVSNLAVFSDSTGHGNQSHLVYAANQQRWWLFVTKTKTATVVSTYVSSSNDLSTATWSAGSDSAVFPSSNNLTSTDHRQLGCLGFANGSTDVAHISVGINTSALATNRVYHVRATFTGASSITWETWNEFNSTNGSSGPAVIGNCLGIGTDGLIHETSCMQSPDFANGYPNSRISTNADTGATWTNGFGATAKPDSQANFIASYALGQLASGAMLLVYGDGGAAQPNTTGLRFNKYTSGASWPTAGSAVWGGGTSSQDQNDWCLITVDTTHTYIIRRTGANTFDWRKYDGSSMSTPANGVPNQTHLAGSGLFACPDGSGGFYLFAMDTGNQLNYVQCSSANGATPTWGTWTTIGGSSVNARNSVSGYPVSGNSQIGVIYTQANGANFDILVESLALTPPPPQAYCHLATTGGWVF